MEILSAGVYRCFIPYVCQAKIHILLLALIFRYLFKAGLASLVKKEMKKTAILDLKTIFVDNNSLNDHFPMNPKTNTDALIVVYVYRNQEILPGDIGNFKKMSYI